MHDGQADRDATFEEGRESPLNLGAFEEEDLRIISALAQDSVFSAADMSWQPAQRRFVVLLNRFRWEDPAPAGHPPERVRSLLVVENVRHVASQGFERRDRDLVLSLLALSFDPRDETGGQVLLTLAGDGAIRLDVEALELQLRDVTRPYLAPSGRRPQHPE
ncbi:DUF2948 family protein [Pontibaca methylaminivorans]|uniref:DUF2948 domain-containing protein n=1 Tax=Pontibaca methylaminivorans TaxID=515897 RepID=A0A1R3WCF3_9RHOB|nr:DUF2948 family protein [Pontibaca methylaminivorans]SIT75017.1 Protein of unknown function [Pontibaca methylaminivorans]